MVSHLEHDVANILYPFKRYPLITLEIWKKTTHILLQLNFSDEMIHVFTLSDLSRLAVITLISASVAGLHSSS